MASERLIDKINSAYHVADWYVKQAGHDNREPNPDTLSRRAKAAAVQALIREGWSDRRIREWCADNDCVDLL